jgi:PAS domain S-box-containing protein
LYTQIFVRDLTQKKEAEDNRRRMEAVFNASVDAMIFIDDAGNYVDANPAACELLGYRRDEIVKMKSGDLAPPADRAAALEIWQQIRSGKSVKGEFTARRKDGATRIIEYRGVGNVLPGYHFAAMHDITGRKEAEAALRQLSLRLLHLQDEERRRIALQLHETTAQSLVALKLNLASARKSPHLTDTSLTETIEESMLLTEQTLNEVRTLSYVLHPPMIEEMGLVPSLTWFARGFEERTGIHLAVDAADDMGRLPPSVETALFRITQEALTNVQRHSGSSVAKIRLRRHDDAVQLLIDDEGRGMPARLRGRSVEVIAAAGVGVAGMYQRVRELNGSMAIHSDDRGTRIEVAVPVAAH